MDLVRDVLDNQLRDREKRKMGKVDGIVMVLRKDKPPRVAFLEVGPATLLSRVSPRLARWVEVLERRLGIRQTARQRIPWSKIQKIGIDVQADVRLEETDCFAWEAWLKKRFIGRIPGAGRVD